MSLVCSLKHVIILFLMSDFHLGLERWIARRRKYWLPLLIIGALTVILILPDFWMPPGTDYGVYFNAGRLILKGLAPYRDFWDHKTPGIYLYLALWQHVFGSGWFSAKAALIPVYFLWGLSIFILNEALFNRISVSLIAALVGIYLSLRLGFDPSRNGAILALSTSFELLAFSLILPPFVHGYRPSFWLNFLGGLFAGLAFVVRQTSITVVIVIAVLVLWSLWSTRSGSILFTVSTPFALGMLVILSALILAAVASRLRAGDVYSALVTFNILYTRLNYTPQTLPGWIEILGGNLFWWVTALLGIAFIKKGRCVGEYTVLYLCLATATGLAFVTVRAESYYRLQYLPYLLVLSTVSLVFYWMDRPWGKLRPAVWTLFIMLFVFQVPKLLVADASFLRQWFHDARLYHFAPHTLPDFVVAAKINSLCNKDDTIFVDGLRAWLYVFSDKQSPTKYFYPAPLFFKGYQTSQSFEQIMADLVAHPPAVIVYERGAARPTDSIFDRDFVERFEHFVEAQYYECADIQVQSAWPSQAREVKIHCRNADQPSRQ